MEPIYRHMVDMVVMFGLIPFRQDCNCNLPEASDCGPFATPKRFSCVTTRDFRSAGFGNRQSNH